MTVEHLSNALSTVAQQTAVAPSPSGLEGAASSALAAQARSTVESRYVMALRKPRDWDKVRADLMRECERPSFANNKSAIYNKPVGDGVTGLGIRFVEVALRCMTNVLCESSMVYEDDKNEVLRVCVTDLESNDTHSMDVKVAKTVERSKPASDGSYISVRMNSWNKPVYTVPANDDDLLNKRGALISKALRTVGLRVIPGYLQDEATETITRIRLNKAAKDPDAERRALVDAFDEVNIGVDQLTEYLGHSLATCTPAEMVELRGLFGALRDGQATWATAMEHVAAKRAAHSKALEEAQKRAAEKAEKKKGIEGAKEKLAAGTPNGSQAGDHPAASKPSGDPSIYKGDGTPPTGNLGNAGDPPSEDKGPSLADVLGMIKRGDIDGARSLCGFLTPGEKKIVEQSIAMREQKA